MGQYFIIAIALYAFVVAVYLLGERWQRRRLNAGQKKGFIPVKATAREDIIGKSNFTLRHSKPQATTLEISEKEKENKSIFADDNRQDDVQDAREEASKSQAGKGAEPNEAEDDSGEIDIVIENEPEGESETDEGGDLDTWETEGEATQDETASSRATGIGFDDLAAMARTVENAASATAGQREEAGRVLAEVRKTGIIHQVAPTEPKKKIVSSLMDDYFAAYYRQEEALPEGAVKAPDNFNVRKFA